jgi:hypothetical protein
VNGQAIDASLRRRRVGHLCHITACRRLPSIFEHGGLLPYSERQRRGIPEDATPHYWGHGKKDSLAEYVVCGFMLPWGMCKDKDEEMVVIVLDAVEVCTRDGVLFCGMNSARGEVEAETLLTQTGVEHLDNCFQNPDSWQAFHSEVFVPGVVPLTAFRQVRFCDQDAADYWTPLIRDAYEHAAVQAPLPEKRIERAVGSSRFVSFPPGWTPTRRIRDGI